MADEDGSDTLWYVAFGSNLSSARLQRYLDRVGPRRAPLERRRTVLPHRLFFAHESTHWTGGTAFVDPTPSAGAETHATAWLLGIDQFLGILDGENGIALGIDPDHLDPTPGAATVVSDRRYGLVLGCSSPDHRPAFTCTTPERPLPSPTVPAGDYVATIMTGLAEGHGLVEGAAHHYLAARGAFG